MTEMEAAVNELADQQDRKVSNQSNHSKQSFFIARFVMENTQLSKTEKVKFLIS